MFTKAFHPSPRHLLSLHLLSLRLLPAALLLGAFVVPQLRAEESSASAPLTFPERLSCERSLEEVRWRHRLWPEQNRSPKPALAAVLPEASLRLRVEQTLRGSAALELLSERPISGLELQTELDRMARGTRAPDVLRELFAALDSDPRLLAECLARPALAERRLRGLDAAQWETLPAAIDEPDFAYTLPAIAAACADDSWRPTTARPAARRDHLSVWTGNEMLMWGGALSPAEAGGVYDPATDRWRPIPLLGEPAARTAFSGVWTGTELVVWGGWAGSSSSNVLASGGRYNPTTDVWRATGNGANLPAARLKATAVWTGDEMIVWGGCSSFSCDVSFQDGGRYDPASDSWRALSPAGAPVGRYGHTAVWSGGEMIVWGGCTSFTCNSPTSSGGRYDPAADSWTPTSGLAAPEARTLHTAVWTGSKLVVWGGCPTSGCFSRLASGGAYDPGSDSWTATATAGAPSARRFHSAIWSPSGMLVFGGCLDHDCTSHTATGGRYDPVANSWTPLDTTGAPSARSRHSAIWTGGEMIVWGGCHSGECQISLSTGGRYRPDLDRWTPMLDPPAPTRRLGHSAVWTGNEMIVWGGFDALNETLTGSRYTPATDSWTDTAIDGVALARTFHSAVWTGKDMLVFGGSLRGIGPASSLVRYDPTLDAWTELSSAGAPSPRELHQAVWTGDAMLVWGGYDAGALPLGTGGSYHPNTDSWSALASLAAPSPRYYHTMLWTGTEMLVWGGFSGAGPLGDGARYRPSNDSWTAISSVAAPPARSRHSAVWTGGEMLVWGGQGAAGLLGDGARYLPARDSWEALPTLGAPSARDAHVAVWTGGDLVVWGGCGNADCSLLPEIGGRYHPASGEWTPTALPFAPFGRALPTAVWTGQQMIVWGGYRGPGVTRTDTGGLYCSRPGPAIFADGFEAGNISAWSLAP